MSMKSVPLLAERL